MRSQTISVREAAELLGISKDTLRASIIRVQPGQTPPEGKLFAYVFGRRLVIPRAILDRLLNPGGDEWKARFERLGEKLADINKELQP